MAAALTQPPSTTKVTARNAVTALLKWRNTKSESQKADLLESDDEVLYVVVTLKKIPAKGRVNAYKIPLPTPLHSPLTEFCLIYDDRPKSKLTKPQIQAKIKADNLPVVKILKYTKLKSDYKAFEAKRKLLNSYDMFLADKQIVPLLPRLLGKHFFKRKRIPVPVDLLKKNWKEQIQRICGSAMLFLSTGTCCVVRVARTSMSEEEIAENVVDAIQGIVEIVPGNWGGVRSLHLKLLDSISLPVYQTVPDEVVKKVEESDKAVEEAKEDVKAAGKESKKKKVGKKGMIQEVRYLDSNAGGVVDEEKSGKVNGDEQVGGSELKGKRKKVVDEPFGKASENDQVDSGEVRKSKRIKEKDVGESKRSKEQKEKKAKLVDEDLEIAEKPTRKAANPKPGKVKGGDGLRELKKSLKERVDAALNMEKPKEKKAKLVDEDLEIAEKPTRKADNPKPRKVKGGDGLRELKKSPKEKVDALNMEKPVEKQLKKSVKVKDDDFVVGKHKNDVLSAKDKKKDVTKKKGDELSGKGREAVGKKEKRKSEPVKLKSDEANPKTAKRSKKGAE